MGVRPFAFLPVDLLQVVGHPDTHIAVTVFRVVVLDCVNALLQTLQAVFQIVMVQGLESIVMLIQFKHYFQHYIKVKYFAITPSHECIIIYYLPLYSSSF